MPTLAGSYRGLTFGVGANTGLHIHAIDGLWDLPNVRNNDLPKAVGEGSFPGEPTLDVRYITLQLLARAHTVADYDTLVTLIVAQTDDVSTLDTLTLLGKTIEARPDRRAIPIRATEYQRSGIAVIRFACPDPTLT